MMGLGFKWEGEVWNVKIFVYMCGGGVWQIFIWFVVVN